MTRVTRGEDKQPLVTSKVLVKDIMNRPIVSAPTNASVKELADKMSKAGVGSVVIVENDKHVGIVSDWDIVSRASVRDEKPSNIVAKDIMQPLQTIESEKPVTDAARFLRKYKTKRLGVVYEGKLVGMVSASDVIAVTPELVDIISEKASIRRGEFGRSVTYISGYCDECDEWSDYLEYTDAMFVCEECRAVTRPGEIPPEHM